MDPGSEAEGNSPNFKRDGLLPYHKSPIRSNRAPPVDLRFFHDDLGGSQEFPIYRLGKAPQEEFTGIEPEALRLSLRRVVGG